MDPEDGVSSPSTPATPGTPGAPLFGGFKHERNSNGRNSLLKSLKCFSVEAWASEEGSLPPVSCALPPPPVSLARKVRKQNEQMQMQMILLYIKKNLLVYCMCFLIRWEQSS